MDFDAAHASLGNHYLLLLNDPPGPEGWSEAEKYLFSMASMFQPGPWESIAQGNAKSRLYRLANGVTVMNETVWFNHASGRDNVVRQGELSIYTLYLLVLQAISKTGEA